jgi:signal transduction histidine kinase
MVWGFRFWLISAGVVLAFSGGVPPAQAMSYQEYKQRLAEAPTGDAFLQAFRSMMTDIRNGLHIPDDEIAAIVAVARSKPFVEAILPEVYGWAGSMYGNGRMEEAIAYFLESAAGYQRLNKHFAEALSYFEIALVQHRAENFVEAEEHYLKALRTGGDSLTSRTRINCHNGIALIQRERKQYVQSEIDFRKALHVAYESRDTVWTAILLGNIGSLHLRMSRYDSSLYYYKKNLSLIKNTSELENEIETYGHLGETMIGMKKYRTALSYLDSAVQIIKDRKVVFSDFFNPMIYLNEFYAYAHEGLGNYDKAYTYLQQFHRLSSERLQKTKGRSLKQLQLSYSFRQKQNEVDLLNEINVANTRVIRQQRFTEVAFLGIIVLLTVIIILSIRINMQRRKLNLQLRSSNEELARLNNIKDKLFSVISHDLRGPLGNLQHLLTMLSTGDLSHDQFVSISGKLSNQIKTSGNALENLLHWAKSQLNEAETTKERVSMVDVSDRVIKSFSGELESKSIVVENLVSNTCAAFADTLQIEIVLRNLVGNAIKFSRPGGHIRLSAQCQDGRVNLSIQDHGVGMTPQQVESFHGGKNFTTPGTKSEKGTGIGLIIIREMITQNGGDIHVVSNPGSGTTFTISLPEAKQS